MRPVGGRSALVRRSTRLDGHPSCSTCFDSTQSLPDAKGSKQGAHHGAATYSTLPGGPGARARGRVALRGISLVWLVCHGRRWLNRARVGLVPGRRAAVGHALIPWTGSVGIRDGAPTSRSPGAPVAMQSGIRVLPLAVQWKGRLEIDTPSEGTVGLRHG